MGKYTANFTCDHELWLAFKDKAQKQGSSASEQLSRFMCSFVQGEATQEEENYIESLIKTKIDEYLKIAVTPLFEVQRDILEKVSQIVHERTYSYKCDTDDTDMIAIAEEIEEQLEDYNLNQNITNALLKTEEDLATEAFYEEQKKQSKLKEKKTALKSKIKHIEESKTITYYTDKEVSEIEGINKSSVTRYRNKKSQPKDSSFWQRWQVETNKKRWIRNHI